MSLTHVLRHTGEMRHRWVLNVESVMDSLDGELSQQLPQLCELAPCEPPVGEELLLHLHLEEQLLLLLEGLARGGGGGGGGGSSGYVVDDMTGERVRGKRCCVGWGGVVWLRADTGVTFKHVCASNRQP